MAEKEMSIGIKVNTETGALEVMGVKLNELADKAKGTESSFKGLSSEAKGLLKSLLPFATMGGVIAFFSSAVKQAEAQNEAIRRLSFAMDANGISWQKNKDKVDAWATSIRETTRFSNDDAYGALEKFIRQTGKLGQAQSASKLAMDLSVASGKPLAESMELISGLVAGNERAVKLANRELGSFTGNAKDAQGALDNISRSVSGASEKEESFTKAQGQLNSRFDEFMELIGAGLLPALTKLTEWANWAIKVFSSFGVMVGEVFAEIKLKAEFTFQILGDIVKLSLKDLGKQTELFRAKMEEIQVSAGNDLEKIWKETTKKHGKEQQERLAAGQRAAEEEAAEREKNFQASKERLAQMELDLNAQLLALDDSTLQARLAAVDAATQAEIGKVEAIGGEEVRLVQDKNNRIIQLIEIAEKKKDQIRANESKKEVDSNKKQIKAAELTAKEKTDMAWKAAGTAIEALQTLNNMGEISSAADVRRAKLLLALQQAIAIARLWAAEASKGAPGIALAAAGTALIVAQFVAQSKAIDKARDTNNQEKTSTSISTDLGTGTTFTDTFSTGGTSGSVGGSSSGSSSGGGTTTVSGGGGVGSIINIGPTSVNFTAEAIDYSNVDMIAKRLGDAVTRANVDAAQMALAIYNSGVKQSGLAR